MEKNLLECIPDATHVGEYFWMVAAEHRIPCLKYLPMHRLSLGVLTLTPQCDPKITYTPERFWMVMAEHQLRYLKRGVGNKTRTEARTPQLVPTRPGPY